MKKFFFFAAALLSAGMLSAQTITIDGANTDWAEVPMLSEPGAAGPIVKMVVPQEDITLPAGAAYCLMVENDGRTDYPVIYTDADLSNTTGTAPWVCPAMGYDYEMATWSAGSTYAREAAMEMCIMQNAFSGLPFTGSVDTYLTYNWGDLYVPTDPTTDNWKWTDASRHPFHVASYTIANLNGEHVCADAISSHYALTLTAEGKFNFSNSGGAQDTAFWVSWPVELSAPAVYSVSANVTSTDNASCDLYLVNMATNTVVATYASEDKWAPSGETEYGDWDLSAVPAGKYMLKMKNHVAWSHMVLTSVTLSGTVTALDQVEAPKAVKVIENGRLVIIRDGVRYDALGK